MPSCFRELGALQSALLADDLPALKKRLSLPKRKTAELRDYLADKANLYRFLYKNGCDAQRARDQLRDTLHWRATEDLPFLSSPPPPPAAGSAAFSAASRQAAAATEGNDDDGYGDGDGDGCCGGGRPLARSPTIDRHLRSGVFYFHGRDPRGRPIGWLNMKEYRKEEAAPEDLGAFVVYVLEVARRMLSVQEAARPLDAKAPARSAEPLQFVIAVDLKGVGLGQLDSKFFLSFVNIYKRYYPGCVGGLHVLNYGMMYAGVWAVAKRVLPEETTRRITCPGDAAEACELLGAENLSRDQGGHSTYQYEGPESNDVYALFALPSVIDCRHAWCTGARNRAPASAPDGTRPAADFVSPPTTPVSQAPPLPLRRGSGGHSVEVFHDCADGLGMAEAGDDVAVGDCECRDSDEESEYFSAVDEHEARETRLSRSSSRGRGPAPQRRRRRRTQSETNVRRGRSSTRPPRSSRCGFEPYSLVEVGAGARPRGRSAEVRGGSAGRSAIVQGAVEVSGSGGEIKSTTDCICKPPSPGQTGSKRGMAASATSSVVNAIGKLLWGSALDRRQETEEAPSFCTGSLLDYPTLNTAIWEDRRLPQERPPAETNGSGRNDRDAHATQAAAAESDDERCAAFASRSDSGYCDFDGEIGKTSDPNAGASAGSLADLGRGAPWCLVPSIPDIFLRAVYVDPRGVVALLLVVAAAVRRKMRVAADEVLKRAAPEREDGGSGGTGAAAPPSWPIWIVVAFVRAVLRVRCAMLVIPG